MTLWNSRQEYEDIFWKSHHHRFGMAGEGQADKIQELLESRSCRRVLNLGCSRWGDKVRNLAACCGRVIAADIVPRSVAEAKATAEGADASFVAADGRALPLGPASVDAILAFGLFAMVHEDRAGVIAEAYRVCGPGGLFVLTNAVRHPMEDYRRLCVEAGFREVAPPMVGYCPAASGSEKRRYMLAMERRA